MYALNEMPESAEEISNYVKSSSISGIEEWNSNSNLLTDKPAVKIDVMKELMEENDIPLDYAMMNNIVMKSNNEELKLWMNIHREQFNTPDDVEPDLLRSSLTPNLKRMLITASSTTITTPEVKKTWAERHKQLTSNASANAQFNEFIMENAKKVWMDMFGDDSATGGDLRDRVKTYIQTLIHDTPFGKQIVDPLLQLLSTKKYASKQQYIDYANASEKMNIPVKSVDVYMNLPVQLPILGESLMKFQTFEFWLENEGAAFFNRYKEEFQWEIVKKEEEMLLDNARAQFEKLGATENLDTVFSSLNIPTELKEGVTTWDDVKRLYSTSSTAFERAVVLNGPFNGIQAVLNKSGNEFTIKLTADASLDTNQLKIGNMTVPFQRAVGGEVPQATSGFAAPTMQASTSTMVMNRLPPPTFTKFAEECAKYTTSPEITAKLNKYIVVSEEVETMSTIYASKSLETFMKDELSIGDEEIAKLMKKLVRMRPV